MRHPLQSVHHLRRTFLWLLAATIVVAVVFQVLGPAGPGIVDLELAFSADRTAELIAGWTREEQLRLAFGMGLDYLFMPLYSTTIALACVWVTSVSTSGWRSAGALFAWVAWLAAVFDASENVAMFTSLLGPVTSTAALVAGVCAVVKFALIIAGIVFVVVALVAGRRREPAPDRTEPAGT